MSPTLPPPVLDHVLSQDVLSAADLARCCLTGRDWLDPARRTLYNSLAMQFVRNPDTQHCHIVCDTVARIEPILQHRHLASLVRWISISEVDDAEHDDEGPMPMDLTLAQLLRVCRNVRWLDVAQTDEDFSAVLLPAHLPLTHLFLNAATPYLHLAPLFPTLQHLGLSLEPDSDPPPANLSIPLPSLHLCSPDDHPIPNLTLQSLLTTFATPNNLVLRRLSIPASVLSWANGDLDSFPSLTSLGLQIEKYDVSQIVKPSVRALFDRPVWKRLESLVFSGDGWALPTYRNVRINNLVYNLPPAIRRINLGEGFSLAEALCILAEGKKRGLRMLEWTPSAPSNAADADSEVIALEKMCRAFGVVFQELPDYHPLMRAA